jgi:hypothetical protein
MPSPIRLLGACLLTAMTSACRSKEPERKEGLLEFGEAIAFIPDGMTGWWLRDHRSAHVPGNDQMCNWIEVRAGRGFLPPTGFGVGLYEGVTVEDYGISGIPSRRMSGWRQAEHIGISGGFFAQNPSLDDWPTQEMWCALVEGRFVVSATSHDLLREALARPRIAQTRWLQAVRGYSDRETLDVVFQARSAGGAELDFSIMTVLKQRPWRLIQYRKEDRIAFSPEPLFGLNRQHIRRSAKVGAYFCTEDEVGEIDDAEYYDVVKLLMLVFGLVVIT